MLLPAGRLGSLEAMAMSRWSLLLWGCLLACGCDGTISCPYLGQCPALPKNASLAPASYQVTALAFDPQKNHLWVGTQDGAVRIDLATGESKRLTTEGEGLPNRRVETLAVDGNGDVWIGYGHAGCAGGRYCGLTRYAPDTGELHTFAKDEHGLIDDRVLSIQPTPNGSLWIGTYAGAVTWQGQSFSPYLDFHDCLQPGPYCNRLWSYSVAEAAFSEDGTGWFAVDAMMIGIQPKPGGVARLLPDRRTDTWNADHGLSANGMQDIALDHGIAWVSGLSGVFVFNPTANRFDAAAALAANDIAVGPRSEVWVASDQGAQLWNPETREWASWGQSGCLLGEPISALLTYQDTVCFGTAMGVACHQGDHDDWRYPYLFE